MAEHKVKILKAELGVQLQEDNDGRVYLSLDGFQMFGGGLPKVLKSIVEKSYDNLVNIRRAEEKKREQK